MTTNTTIPSAFTFVDACTGEAVAVSGEIHLLRTTTVNDNVLSSTLHTEFKATGIGLTSGLSYQEQVVFNEAVDTSLLDGQATLNLVGVINVVAPGPGNNQWSPISSHVTFDANGNLTAFDLDPPTVACK